MAWNAPRSFPRAILHVDGDSFFASCEVARDPSLRGKPVITGAERGIISSMTYEAKRAGLKRGTPLGDVKKICPDAVILPSDYETYGLFSDRMYEIVRRYTPAVEEYSIDECFADLGGMRRVHQMTYPQIAAAIKRDLERELGMTFSAGLAPTKTLAKVGSKWKKPDGLTLIPLSDAPRFLARMEIGRVWGIGPNTAAYLQKFGIRTAADFANHSETWVQEHLSKPFVETWRELRGELVLELDLEGRESYQSISKTKTFTPPSRDPRFVYAQLSKNTENACIKTRRWKLAASSFSFFLKTQDFRYRGCEVKLPHPTSAPQEILACVEREFPQVFRKNTLYRATGITLLGLKPAHTVQLDLFGAVRESEKLVKVFEGVDAVSEKYGKHIVFLGSSFAAMKMNLARGGRGGPSTTTPAHFRGESARRRLATPYLGEVS